MAKKQAQMLKNAKGVLIEPSERERHAPPAKGLPMNKQKRIETLEECLLSNHNIKNMYNQLKDGQ